MGSAAASTGIRAQTAAYSTERPALRLVPPRSEPALSPEDALNLKFFFCEFEAEALGANTGGVIGESGITGYDGGQVRLADERITRRANWVRERLLRMAERGQAGLIVALYRMHGPKPPGIPYAEFRDLAPLAEMTDAVEEARIEMGRKGGVVRAAEVEEASEAERARRFEEAERDFWQAAGAVTKVDAALARLALEKSSGEPPDAVRYFWQAAGDVERLGARLAVFDGTDAYGNAEWLKLHERSCRRREALERHLSVALRALRLSHADRLEALTTRWLAARAELAEAFAVVTDPDASVARATETARHAPTRELSAGDVLRAQLTYRGKVDAKGKPDKDAHAAWTVSKSAFVSRVRIEAEKLRVASALAYSAARWP